MSDPRSLTLTATRVRVDLEGVPQCEGLTFELTGARLVIAGPGASAVSSALSLQSDVVSGALRVDERDVCARAHLGHVGLAPFDLPMPASCTALQFLADSFVLGGSPRREAGSLAARVLLDLGLGHLMRRRASTLHPAERRAVILAQAMLPGARVLFSETPVAGLESGAARLVLNVLAAACKTRSVLTSVTRFDSSTSEHDLIMGADRIAVLSSDGVVWTGAPMDLLQDRRLVLTVRGDADGLAERLKALGANVVEHGARMHVVLPEGASTTAIGQAAADANAVVIEMVPLPG